MFENRGQGQIFCPFCRFNILLEITLYLFSNYSGESAFCTLAKYFFWSKLPFISRINELDSNIPLTAIYGGNSWMPSLTREEFEHARNGEGYSRSRVIFVIKSRIKL